MLPTSQAPFSLYRQEGWERWNSSSGAYEFGSYAVPVDGGGPVFIIGRPDTENLMTPADVGGFPVSKTVSMNSGATAPGYVDVSVNDPGDSAWPADWPCNRSIVRR